ncbi:hypothetical protein A8B76_05345 [Roseovarius indicus]|nr:hypothetical protein A8B76_05345 [Roseovarius indicus]
MPDVRSLRGKGSRRICKEKGNVAHLSGVEPEVSALGGGDAVSRNGLVSDRHPYSAQDFGSDLSVCDGEPLAHAPGFSGEGDWALDVER